ncbi:uncharacterized protein HD556DRAFT_1333074 [Suillus plorans]|uniref:Uncharacterized protein n=1 Tax=Suillus plorans TaxID=116603 RepID=A0A9P7DTP6_9AGAM|nr:uncharacterized protein HD556DRAFT_1333074 [Suillus plorans]KAG1802920.1 hypothetical protein HD556DRAFT_1333074 [Suillus plorans]
MSLFFVVSSSPSLSSSSSSSRCRRLVVVVVIVVSLSHYHLIVAHLSVVTMSFVAVCLFTSLCFFFHCMHMFLVL